MQNIKKAHLHYERKEAAGKIVRTLKDQNGIIKFLKTGIGPWVKIEMENKE